MKINIDGTEYKKIYFRKKQGETAQKTASGENIILNDSVKAPLKVKKTFGKSVQETTSGNQLAESYEAGTGVAQYLSVLFVKAELKPSTTYTISFEGTVGNWLYLNEQITAYKQFQVVSGRTVVTFTTVENMDSSNASKYDVNKGWIICKNNNAQSAPNVFDNLMLNLGSTALPYEEFTGGIPSPNPEYPQPIVSAGQKLENGIVSDVGISKKLTGKNLLPYPFKGQTNTQNGITFTNNNDGSVTANGTATADCYFSLVGSLVLDNECILSDAGTTKANTIFVYAYNQDTKTYYYTYSNQTPTLPAGKYDVNIKINSGATVSNAVFKPMIRYADIEDDTYEPYTEQTLTLNRVLRGIPVTDASLANYTDADGQMWCADEIDVERGVLVQRVGEWVLSPISVGGDGWTEHSTGLGHYTKLPSTIESNSVLPAADQTAFALCSIATCTTWSNMLLKSGNFALSYDGYIGFCYSGTLEEFKIMLDTEKPVVHYILATPIETPLTDEEIVALRSLRSYNGETCISTDNDPATSMDIEYTALISEDDYVLYKKLYIDGVLAYTLESQVTYVVDTDKRYTEKVEYGYSCLSPKTFTPTKSGWTFVGWREDTAANSSVLTSKTMGLDPITLYAVFEKDVTATFVSYNSSTPISGKAYYNNGTVKNYTVTAPSGAAYTGWTWRGWSAGGETAADAAVKVPNGGTITDVSANTTFYGLYNKTVTRTFHSMNGTSNKSESVSGAAYYNASGTTAKASIVVPSGGTYTGWSWRGWSGLNSTAADANVVSESGKTIYTLDDGDVYGLYQQTITLSYNGNSADSGSVSNQSGTRYYNAAGNTKNPSFTLTSNGYTRNGYEWIAWAKGSAGGSQFASGASVVLSSNTTFYAVWERVATPYYAIQNGSLVNCPNAVAEQQGGHNNRSGVITLQTSTVYGAYGHTSGSDNYWGAYTGNLNTEGCAKLSFTFATFETTVSAEVRDYWVYGDEVEIEHETINSVTAYSEYTASRTVDVSNYSTVAVRVRIQDNNNSDAWMGAGFIEVRLHV